MSTEAITAIVGGAIVLITSISGVFNGIMTYLMAKLKASNEATAAAAAIAARKADVAVIAAEKVAEKADVAAVAVEKVATDLAESATAVDAKLERIHILVNNQMSIQLEENYHKSILIAKLTQEPELKELAEEEVLRSKKRLDAHMAKQADVDAKAGNETPAN